MRKRIWLLFPLAALLPVTLMLTAPAAEPPSPSATAPIPAAPPTPAPAPQAATPATPSKQQATPAAPATPSKEQAATPAAPAAAPGPGPTAAATGSPTKFSRDQLEQMLAPIALYPDQLLGQVLMASTYPAEVVEAARWVRVPAHRRLKGDALAAALKPKGWDPSVMALVPFPRVLELMSERLDWLRGLGTAFIAQQAEVMAAVQQLRHLAMAAGTLKTTPQCHCTVSTVGETITIATAASEPVCVPVYHTRIVYGAWPYPAYPPIEFPVPYGVAFVPGYYIGFYPPIDVAWYQPLWGWDSIDWGAGSIIVDSGRYALLAAGNPGFPGNAWVHNPGRWGAVSTAGIGAMGAAAGMAAALPGMRGMPGGAAGVGGRAALAARAAAGGRWGAHGGYAFAGHGGSYFGHAYHNYGMHGGGHFGGPHFAMRGGHFGGGHFGGGHFGGPHFAMGMHGGGHFGGPHFAGPHFGGPHFAMGGPGGGHFGGGGGPHFAMGGGGGGHGGGGPHGGGGGGGGGHGGGHH